MNTEALLRKAAVKVQYQYLLSLLKEKADFPYAIIKGEALSCQAFGEPGQRQSSDIDLLIEKKNLKNLESILLEDGFETEQLTRQEQVIAKAFSHQTAPYQKKLSLGNLLLDINYELLWGEWDGPRPLVADFLKRCEMLQIYGLEVPALSISDAFLQLCLHHYKDMNSLYHLAEYNPITYKAFLDIAAFWQRRKDEMDWSALTCWMDTYRLKPYFYYILYHTAAACEMPELAEQIADLKTPEGEALLDQFGLAKAEKKDWPLPFAERLDNPELPQVVRRLLTPEDQEKLKQNQKIFGGV